ncbi:MAG: hypothetical protein JWP01_1164 [Myxococcales bacterium]|nr:hypothetical protein [Myxococcales bacterium]
MGSGHLFVLVLVAACGGGGTGDDEPGVDAGGGGADSGGGSVSCTATASITAMMAAKTVTGVGKAECTGPASLEIETCVQWNPSGTFVDIQCMETTRSGMAMLQVDNLASCGISAGRRFRARVNVKVNGVAKPEALSADIACF